MSKPKPQINWRMQQISNWRSPQTQISGTSFYTKKCYWVLCKYSQALNIATIWHFQKFWPRNAKRWDGLLVQLRHSRQTLSPHLWNEQKHNAVNQNWVWHNSASANRCKYCTRKYWRGSHKFCESWQNNEPFFFSKSEHEISYFDLRLQPTIFQDDISRLSSSRVSAQTGNIFVSSCMESKLLDLNVDKSCFIIIGNTSYTQDLRNEIKQYPLQLCGIMMKEKTTDKYLGDLISSEGLASSVHATIMDRFSRVHTGMVETRAIVQDCRSQVVGGITSGLELWEATHIPSLLNNCETWILMSEKV